jgi:very-short-patch-repair endonuclease
MVGFTKEAIAASRIARKQNSIAHREKLIEEYSKSPKYCENEKCKNTLSYTQSISGIRFCCRSCSNTVVKRLEKEESRKKVSAKLSKPAQTEWVCSQCSSIFTSLTRKKICSEICYKKAKIVGAKKAAQTMKENGTYSGWHNRRFEPSYPEQYFIDLFTKEQIIGWEREKKVGRWFIDFAFLEQMIAVEIDGRQHEDVDRKQRDEEKDLFLNKCGWKVIRIKWKNPKDENGKAVLYPQIKSLMERICI